VKTTKSNEVKIPAFYGLGAFLITVAVVVDISYDPVNLTKLILLSIFGFSAFFVTQKMNHSSHVHGNRIYYLVLLIPIWMLLSAFISESPLELSFWGEYGRNTGLLAYLSLSLFFLAIVNYQSKSLLRAMLFAFFFSGLANTLYGNFAFFSGTDPIPWNNPFAPAILGTFGNPNFIGAFMGMFAGFIFAYLLFCKPRGIILFGGLVLEVFVIIGIYAARATQGFLVFGLTTAFVLFFWLRQTFTRAIFANLYLIGLSGIGSIVALGIFNVGPLGSLLYKDSIAYRGQYWTAGINMANSSPIFGTGPDSYGTWYRTYRDPSALVSPGVDVTTNAAHSVFIDFLVNGGYPLLILYVGFTAFVLVKAIKGLLSSKKVDFLLLSFTSIWIGYLAQSLLSINQLGLAIWGWIAPACILLSLKQEPSSTTASVVKTRQKGKSGQAVISFGIIGMVIGGLLSTPMLIAEKNWRDALEIGSLPRIEKTLEAFPRNSNRYILGIKILTNNNLDNEALKYVKELNEFDSNNFVGWDYLMNVRLASPQDKERALKEMKRLDPNRKFD
jgi:O-antigen ligase